MATLTRPGKEGSATTYQGKVAAGYTKILASEVDADIDTLYAAFNGGVDTVNISDGAITTPKIGPGQVTTATLADGAVTQAKLADGAVTQAKLGPGVTAIPSGTASGDLKGSYPGPQLSTVQSGIVALNPRASVQGTATYAELQGNVSTSPGWDSGKAVWLARLNYSVDQFELWRGSAGGSATWSTPLVVDSAGNFTALGLSRFKARAGGCYMPSAIGPLANGASLVLPLTTVWCDTGGLYDAGVGGLHSPAFNVWAILNSVITISFNGGFGFVINIEEETTGGSAWHVVVSQQEPQSTGLQATIAKPMAPNWRYRVNVTNLTGSNVNINAAQLTMMILGVW